MLRDRGIPANHTSEIGLAQSADASILEFAASEGSVVVTLDLDFPRIVALAQSRTPTVILLRLTELKALPTADLLETLLSGRHEEIELGAVITVDKRGVRSRRLPLA